MFVYKRSGRKEPVHFDKITARLKKLCYGLDSEHVDAAVVSQKVCLGVYKGVTTVELDELAAETAAHLVTSHPDYAVLAARVAVSNLHKMTSKSFSKTIERLHAYVNPKTGKTAPKVSDALIETVRAHAQRLDSCIVYDRDYSYDYFGFKTLERSYLLKINDQIVERPQHMLMRVALGIHGADIDAVINCYELMSEKWFTHATPTLFNAGTPHPQLSSCFLLTMAEDSIEGIYDTLKRCAQISKCAGGIGLSVHKIRAQGSYICGSGGESNGLVPMLRCFNNTARYVDQGGGKRKGAFAVYLEPWHADVFDFLDLRKNHGVEEMRARDLFYALWVPDLFMRLVESDGDWSLFCPNEAPGLHEVWGEEFETLYYKYVNEDGGAKVRRTVKARVLWQHILESQTETGTPYVLYKDACNRKSNQQNLGTIKSSNLCTEIIEYTSKDEVAVCNLASIALPRFVKDGAFDFQKLYEVSYVVCKNLNKVIDVNYYPISEAEHSNLRHRPIGIGVQGLADTFLLLRLSFTCDEAKKLNKDIFETIYFAAMTCSKDLAARDGPYPSYHENGGCPVSKGVFQYDMWGVTPSDRWDWATLKQEVAKHGVRNSLLLAPMPTASTSQILGNNECFEPYTSNIYVRRTLAGEFVCVSRHLLLHLMELGLWSPEMKNKLIAANGSVQGFLEIPEDVRKMYRTVWEISGKDLIQMASDRGAFIDQSQSFNVHMTNVNFGKLSSMHFYGWKAGLKTGMYYLRTKAATDAIKFTVDAKAIRESADQANNKELELQKERERKAAINAAKAEVKLSNSPLRQKKVADDNKPASSLVKEKLFADDAKSKADDDESEAAAWRAKREQQKEAMICSLENKDACLSCGS